MKITLITVGKIKEKYLKDAIAEYSKRLSKYCKLEIVEVADEKTPDQASENVERQIRQKEGERILRYVKDDAYVFTLEIGGTMLDSVAFAKKMETLGIQGKSHLIFIIGGSIGLGEEVLRRSDYALSFSKMTFPHQLMRVILLEQVYRAIGSLKVHLITNSGGRLKMVKIISDSTCDLSRSYWTNMKCLFCRFIFCWEIRV